MLSPCRRFPAPWRADKIAGGYVLRDANNQALAYIFSREEVGDAEEYRELTARGEGNRHRFRKVAGTGCEVEVARFKRYTAESYSTHHSERIGGHGRALYPPQKWRPTFVDMPLTRSRPPMSPCYVSR